MPLNNDDIKQLIAILQKGLTEDISDSDTNQPTKTLKSNKKKNTENIKRNSYNSVQNRENKFLTLGLDKLHKEDVSVDKLLIVNPPTPRTRQMSLISVKCRVCGKEEKISSTMLYDSADRYKCNKCCSSPG